MASLLAKPTPRNVNHGNDRFPMFNKQRDIPTYYGQFAYDNLVDQILQLKPRPFAGKVTADQVKIVLGEVGDIWPVSIIGADDDQSE